MNDLGLTLTWLAVQVALVLVPALAVHALASRRGPASGAWVAGLSLGLVVALSAAAFVTGIGPKDDSPTAGIRPSATALETAASAITTPNSTDRVTGHDRARPVAGLGRALGGVRLAWFRFERGAAVPAERCRPWGSALAAVALAGTGVGLLRLMIGLWAVSLCRRRGRVVDDPGMTELLSVLRSSMGYRRPVELREVPDMSTPATAGWRRPVLLLPDDWRSWDASERRAVLAHELAHIIRGDYVAGLLARLAVVLNFYHPLVRWMAGRLQLQQELAADALGARFAGGRASYLVALSRLALRQDGRSPYWPARAFLPARGTLIRRIAMLRDEIRTGPFDRPWSVAWRLPTALGLIGLTVGVAALRGPARGAEDGPPRAAAAKVEIAPHPAAATAFETLYVSDGMDGVVAFRPAATLRRTGKAPFVPRISDFMDSMCSDVYGLAKGANDKEHAYDLMKLDWEDIEWFTCGVLFDHTKNVHRIVFVGYVVRTVAPFDWRAFFRQWRLDFDEVRERGLVYYRITGPLKGSLGTNPCVYLPDDRTLVFDEEEAIRKLAGRRAPAPPAYLCGPDWERVSRGLLAIAINNHDGTFVKHYDLGRPDDAVVLSLFEGVDRWVLGVDDADAIVLHAAAACRSHDASEAIARAIDSLVKLGRDAVEHPDPDALANRDHGLMLRMATALLANLRVGPTDRSVDLHAEGFGTLNDFASIVEREVGEVKPPDHNGGGGSQGTKR